MTYTIYCLYASMRDDEPSPWMIAAEDEYAWEGNPERCEAVFKAARQLADRNDWDVREIELTVDLDAIYAAFNPTSVQATAKKQDES